MSSTDASRRRRWLLPAAVVLLWLLVGGPLASFAGQLSSVQENDNAGFLPDSAESTEALEELAVFTGEQTLPVTVVVEREGGLTRADRRAVAALGPRLAEVATVADDGVGPLEVSEDGAAGRFLVQLATDDGDEIVEAVEELRTVLDDAPDGLTVLAGGQGGVLADFVAAFGAIDGLLLVVALAVVLVILVVVYRSPVLPLVVLVSAVLGLGVASAAVYGLAVAGVLDLSGQSQGILFILAIGAATDYSLLLVSRFREELRDREAPGDAMRAALRGTWEPVVASAVTVVLGLACLLLSDLSNLAGLGPVGALGIIAAVLSSLTLLPAVLMLLGRRAFWPLRPAYGSAHQVDDGVWARVSGLVGRRPVAVAATCVLLLGLAAAFAPTLEEDPIPQTDVLLSEEESVTAQDVLEARFDDDTASPVQVVTPAALLPDVVRLLSSEDGVAPARDGVPAVVAIPVSPEQPTEPLVVEDRAVVLATLADPAESSAAGATVERLRTDLAELETGPSATEQVLVGGATAIQLDTRDTTARDRAAVIPSILLVIFLVLALLLRSLVSAVVLVLANVLSFAATVGVSALVFEHLLGFPSSDPTVLLIGFVFLVALGIDYSIFLMTRVREETLAHGTRDGIARGLRVTGGVITSAGVVLAATFAALGVVPILFLAQIAFIVSFGVLLDTFVVRSLLVPAVCHLLGPRTWWPSRLARAERPGAQRVGGAHRA